MISITNVKVYDFDESVRASKYPMSVDIESLNCDVTPRVLELASNPPGSGHNNFLSGILVAFDLKFTVKAWYEFERYHFAQIVSSQSTMHRITKFNLDEAYCEYVDPRMVAIMKELVAAYNADPNLENYRKVLYSSPQGFMFTARITTNYLQLKTMYHQRKDHRLVDWLEFCEWIRTLPHSSLITERRRKPKLTDAQSLVLKGLREKRDDHKKAWGTSYPPEIPLNWYEAEIDSMLSIIDTLEEME